jgi:predicted LPLAT superfamily acyltransferase
VFLIRWMGLRLAYAWLALVAVYFLVASRQSYRSSRDFLCRVLGPQPFWKWPWLIYRHFYAHGMTLLDRLAVIMKRTTMDFTYEREALFREYLDQGQGVILLGAHLGNWEMGGHLLGRHGIPVNFVVLEREEAQIRRLFAQVLREKKFNILTASDDPFRSIPIMAALRRGEIVALHGDRSFGGTDVVVPFLGRPAQFPVGAYLLAAATGAPIFQVFSVREKPGKYRFFSYPAQHVPRAKLRNGGSAYETYARLYAQRLEEVARQYPYQWGNFYPFWDSASAHEYSP